MKNILYILSLFVLIISGCTSADNTAGGVTSTEQTDINRLLTDKDETIRKLEAARDRLQEQIAQMEQSASAVINPELKCPNLTIGQEEVDLDEYAGYQKIEGPCYTIYIPKKWTYRILGRELEFVNDRLIIGNTEILDFLTREAAEHYVTNHAEQTDFKEQKEAKVITGTDYQIYYVGLRWEKPAAALDPDWKYDETKVFLAFQEFEWSFVFNFSTLDVPASIIDKIIHSFRLNSSA